MNPIRFAQGTALVGIATQLTGLGIDAYLHSQNPELAHEEGIFTLGNPGHALLALGLMLTVLGVCLAWYLGWASRRATPRRWLARLVPVLGIAVLASASGIYAFQADAIGHDHAHSAAAADHTQASTAALTDQATGTANATSAPASDGHSHAAAPPVNPAGMGAPAAANQDHTLGVPGEGSPNHGHDRAPGVAISMQELEQLTSQLAVARDATAKYADIRAAQADGYLQITQDIPGIAAHFAQPRLLNGSQFDPAKPSILLYEKHGEDWVFVGVSYTIAKRAGDETQPAGFAGPLDVWHYHQNLCFTAGPVVSVADAASCRAKGGLHAPQTPWMLHVWLAKDSPEGIFSDENSLVI